MLTNVKAEHLLTNAEAAAIVGIKTVSWRKYVSDKRAPEPDLIIGGKPLWLRETVVTWNANRRGRGWRKGVRG